MMRRNRVATAALLLAALVAASCGGGGSAGETTADGDTTTLRLGYFPNVTHAPAIVGVEKGFFAEHLGDTKLETKTFNAGGEAVTALFGGQLDATYIGPNPAINAHQRSNGEAIRIIAGATSGGAFLVVKPDITSAADLEGKTLATPQLGNTQDVALRAWLKGKGLNTDTRGGGDVSIKPQENSQTLDTFKSGQIQGAWVPEPWATRLQQEGGGKVLVDERDLWPKERYVTTHVIVRTEYLNEHPDVVKALLEGHLESIEHIASDEDDAKTTVNAGIEKLTTKSIPPDVLDPSWENLTFTIDPLASSLQKSAADAIELGLLEPVELDGIYDLAPLNELLKADGEDEVEGL